MDICKFVYGFAMLIPQKFKLDDFFILWVQISLYQGDPLGGMVLSCGTKAWQMADFNGRRFRMT